MSEVGSLRNENRRLKEVIERYKRRIASQNARISSLVRTIQELSVLEEPLDDNDVDMMEYTGQGTGSALGDEAGDGEEDEEEDEDEPCYPSAVWDDVDKVFRCNKCCWETENGVCDYCSIEYDVPESRKHSLTMTRLSALRTAKIDPSNPEVPWFYRINRVDEYAQLRRRGATVEMCKTFSLSFDMDKGITAVLTPQIKETFGGPEMLETDTWKLYLGRRVTLDEDDSDGSDFIIGLLEDALLFEHPHHSIGHKQWTTARPKGKTNLWKTYPTKKHMCYIYEVSDTSDDSGDDSGDCPDSEAPEAEIEAWYNRPDNECTAEDKALVKPFVEFGPTIHRDEYEMTDVEDLESDDDGDPDAADAGYTINPRYDDRNWPDGENDGMYESEPEPEDRDDDYEADEDEDSATQLLRTDAVGEHGARRLWYRL
ncbi:hypothetical protein K435DRAFT_965702 [Dendrothele bispora CBS 962.96]|uniref:DUF8191 domain-containing protein n=1 Tax=Dendrothele bispora (strain CBS 962.96) TaxID=1314807 RepID=A0A4S8M424_DENBC|nr:hypothetical protein K435DRAFT_965702 [Dendrothele bispora CBS 962.96]